MVGIFTLVTWNQPGWGYLYHENWQTQGFSERWFTSWFHHSRCAVPIYWYGRNPLSMKHLGIRMKPCDKAEPVNYKLLRTEAFFICVPRYDHQNAFWIEDTQYTLVSLTYTGGTISIPGWDADKSLLFRIFLHLSWLVYCKNSDSNLPFIKDMTMYTLLKHSYC